jgi:hypothetical protein
VFEHFVPVFVHPQLSVLTGLKIEENPTVDFGLFLLKFLHIAAMSQLPALFATDSALKKPTLVSVPCLVCGQATTATFHTQAGADFHLKTKIP